MITMLSSKPFPMICIMVLQWHALPDHGHSDIVLVLTGTEACPRLVPILALSSHSPMPIAKM